MPPASIPDRLEGGSGDDTYLVDDAGDVVADSGGSHTVETTLNSYTPGAAIEILRFTGTGNNSMRRWLCRLLALIPDRLVDDVRARYRS